MPARGFMEPTLRTAAALLALAAASGPALAQKQSTEVRVPDSSGSLVVDFAKKPDAPAETKVEPKPAEEPAAPPHGEPGHLCRTGDSVADAAVNEAAGAYGLDPCLVVAVMGAESGFRRLAVSPKGACGYMQLMPETARRFGVVDIFDTRQNILAGTRYLRWLLDRFGGSLELALAGYNAGEGAVERYGRKIPPFFETQNYVRIITRRYYTRHAGQAALRSAVAAAPRPTPAPASTRPPAAWRISTTFEE
jgi:soluble lytic murein transglycosylase-like protein